MILLVEGKVFLFFFFKFYKFLYRVQDLNCTRVHFCTNFILHPRFSNNRNLGIAEEYMEFSDMNHSYETMPPFFWNLHDYFQNLLSKKSGNNSQSRWFRSNRHEYLRNF